jgi:hypothetical protein
MTSQEINDEVEARLRQRLLEQQLAFGVKVKVAVAESEKQKLAADTLWMQEFQRGAVSGLNHAYRLFCEVAGLP